MNEPRDIISKGAHLAAFVGGHAASLHIKGAGGASWTTTAARADDNHEALRRVLTAAVCWLDGQDALVSAAEAGEVVLRPEREQQHA